MARHTIKFRQYVLVCAALVGFTRGSNSQNQYDSTYWAAQSELNAFANQAKLQAQQDQFDTLEKQLTLSDQRVGLAYSLPNYLKSFMLDAGSALALKQAASSNVGKSVGDELLARNFIRQGRPEEALAYLGSSEIAEKEARDPATHAALLRIRATAYLSIGNFVPAAGELEQAVKAFQALGNTKEEADSLVSLGWAYQSIGDFPRTFASYDQALKLYAKLGDQDGQARVRMAAGSLYNSLGKPTWALQQYQAAWRDASEKQRAWMLASNAEILMDYNESSRALAHYEAAMKLIAEGGDDSFEASIQAGMARAHMVNNNFLGASLDAESALSKMRNARNRAGEACVLAILGEIHLWQAIKGSEQRPTRTIDLSLFDDPISYHDDFMTRSNHEHSPWLTPEPDPVPQFKLALHDYSQALSIMREVGDRSGEIGVLTDTGTLYDAWGKHNEALSYYLRTLNKLEELQTSARLEEFRINLAEQASALYQRAAALELSFHHEELAFNLSERARARSLLDHLGSPRIVLAQHAPARVAAAEEALRDENIALRRRLAEEMTRPGSEFDQEKISSIQSRLAVIHKQYDDLIVQLKLTNPEYAAFLSISPLTIAELQAQLGLEVTVVSYYTTPLVSIAFVIRQHEFRAVRLLATEAQISAATATVLDFAGEQNSPSLTQLYKWLIAPIRSELKTPLLAIAPFGILHDLPFAALTADGKRYLNDDYTVFLLPSASAWAYVQARTKPATGGRALIMANDHVSGQSTLPHAYEEAEAVASLLGTAPRLGSDATGEVFKTTAGESEIVHLIGHISPDKESPGFSEVAIGGNSTDSGLQLNDILNLRLDKTTLVVLSGCQSNSGVRSRADNVSSLSSAFLYAGTPSVVASLWNVTDVATKELMIAFYTHLKDGMGKAEALRAAQQDVRRTRPNPYYWAGFVLTGDPGTTSAWGLMANSNK